MGELLGRSAELHLVGEALGADSGAVVVHGEAGVGKTTLATHVLASLDHRAGGALGTLTWLPFLALRRAFPELPEGTWSGDADYVAAAVQAALGGATLLVEDLHWAHPQTLDVVTQLIGRVRLLATVRRGTPAAADAVEQLEKAGATRVDLDPLDPTTARRLAERIGPGLTEAQAAEVVRRSGGNPLLIEELSAGGEVPTSLERALLARCRQLSEAQLDGLAMLALAGQPLRALGLPDPLGLVESGLVVVNEEQEASVRHALVGEVVDGLLSPERRIRCHRALAGLLDQPGDIARHLLAAGDRAGAHEAALRAVEAAQTPGERWRHLVTAADSASGDTAAELLLKACQAALAASEIQEAGRLLADLEATGAMTGPLAGAVALARANEAYLSGDVPRFATEVARGRDLVDADSPEVGVLRAREAMLAYVAEGDVQRALELALEGVELARATGGPTLHAKGMVAVALAALGRSGWRDYFEEAISEARARDDTEYELNSRHNYVISLTAAGELEPALAEAAKQVERCESLRLRKKTRAAHVARLIVVGYRGDLARAEQEATRLLGLSLRQGDRLDVVALFTKILGEQGRLAEVLEWAEEMVPSSLHETSYRAARGMAFVQAGQPERALVEWELFDNLASVNPYEVTECAPLHAWTAWELGSALPERPASLVGGLYAGVEPELDGLHALAAEQYAAAREHFERATRLHGERRGQVLWCRWAVAEAARLNGTPDAESLLRGVREEAEAEGFVPVVTRCERSLRAMGVRLRRSQTPPSHSVLTSREREVADLVVEGLTDHEIAARLGVAARTVESHLASARRKLGAANRSHLVALLDTR